MELLRIKSRRTRIGNLRSVWKERITSRRSFCLTRPAPLRTFKALARSARFVRRAALRRASQGSRRSPGGGTSLWTTRAVLMAAAVWATTFAAVYPVNRSSRISASMNFRTSRYQRTADSNRAEMWTFRHFKASFLTNGCRLHTVSLMLSRLSSRITQLSRQPLQQHLPCNRSELQRMTISSGVELLWISLIFLFLRHSFWN